MIAQRLHDMSACFARVCSMHAYLKHISLSSAVDSDGIVRYPIEQVAAIRPSVHSDPSIGDASINAVYGLLRHAVAPRYLDMKLSDWAPWYSNGELCSAGGC